MGLTSVPWGTCLPHGRCSADVPLCSFCQGAHWFVAPTFASHPILDAPPSGAVHPSSTLTNQIGRSRCGDHVGPSAATWRFMLPHRWATSMSLSFRRPPVRSVVRADLRAHCFCLRLHSKRCGGGRPTLSGIPCCLGYHAVCYCAIDTNPTAACPAGRYHECHDPSLESELGQVSPTAQPRRTGHCGPRSIDRLGSRLLSIGVGLRGLRRCAVGRNCKPGFFL